MLPILICVLRQIEKKNKMANYSKENLYLEVLIKLILFEACVFIFRYDWYAMGNFIVISVFAKLSDPGQTFVEANQTSVSIESLSIV